MDTQTYVRNILAISAFYAFALSAGKLGAAPATTITPNGLGTSVMSPMTGFYNIQGGTNPGNGSNLFHSFSTFNLGTDATADFNVSSNIANILARVTGGPSSIDGTITSTLGPATFNMAGQINNVSTANLFFLNPAGVMFTANAQVNLGGSFIVSTANVVKFSDGTMFYGDVNHPIQDAGLKSAPVSAFGFLTPTPQPISFAGAQLSVKPKKGLDLVGGNVTLDDATLKAPSGKLTIFSAASKGKVPFSLASPGSGYAATPFSAFGNITVKNKSSVAIDGAGGGNMVIRGGQIVVDNSTISSANSASNAGGGISVQADQLSLTNGGTISSQTTGSGAGGAIMVQASAASVDGFDPSGSFPSEISSSTSGAGDAGPLTFDLTTGAGTLSLTNGGEVGAYTLANVGAGGAGGAIAVQANAVSIDGGFVDSSGTFFPSGIYSFNNSGNAGILTLNLTTGAGTLNLTNGGEIYAATLGSGQGGAITVQAQAVTIDGGFVDSSGFFNPSSITSLGDSTGPTGNVALNLTTGVGTLTLTNGGVINGVGGSGTGDSGDITVQANAVSIDGGFVDPSGNFNASKIFMLASGTGNVGAIKFNLTTGAGTLSLTNGGEINANASSIGNAGNITVQANAVTIDGGGFDAIGAFHASEIESATESSASDAGNAGTLSFILTTGPGTLSLTNGGVISGGTTGAGSGGEITVQANAVTIDGGSFDYFGFNPSQIYTTTTSDSAGAGSAGTIKFTLTTGAGTLSVTNGAEINADTAGTGDGGQISVQANAVSLDGGSFGDFVLSVIDSSSQSTAPGAGNAGSISFTLTTGPGTLNVTNGAKIIANTVSTGNGGKITIQANAVTIDGGAFDYFGNFQPSLIASDTSSQADGAGKGGTINLTLTTGIGALSVTNGGEISADTSSTGDAGQITVQANTVSVDGGLVGSTGYFYESLIDSSSLSSAIGAGNAGSITFTLTTGPGTLNLTNGGFISANTAGPGQGGKITFEANAVTIDGGFLDSSGYFNVSGVESGTASDAAGAGNAGTVTFTLITGPGTLSLTDGGAIVVGTLGTGNGGDIIVQANAVSIDGGLVDSNGYFHPSVVDSVSSGANGAGNAGTISFTLETGAGLLSLTNGAEINADTAGTGNGGEVTVQANTVRLAGESFDHFGDVFHSIIEAASLSDAPGAGNAGTVTLNANRELSLTGNSKISTSAPHGNGGDIQLHVGGLVYFLDSTITASAQGTGGNITIDPEFVVLDNSPVTAFGGISNGNIMITTNYFLANDSPVTASGALTISAPVLDLSGSLLALPTVLVSEENRLREKCARAVNHEFSTFIVVGRSGTESAPNELQPDFGMTTPPLALNPTTKSSP